MKLTIDGKEYEFKFNFRFIRELDKTKEAVQNGIAFGLGVNINLSRLINMQDPIALAEILMAASDNRLSMTKLEKFFDDEDTDVEAIMEETIAEIEKGKFTAKKVKALKEQVENV